VTRLGIADLQAEKLEAVKAEFPDVEIEAFECNVAEEEDVKNMVSGTVSKVNS
jgi:NADP-dependent 3-hydroxy acid dehydrogenase YdfG